MNMMLKDNEDDDGIGWNILGLTHIGWNVMGLNGIY